MVGSSLISSWTGWGILTLLDEAGLGDEGSFSEGAGGNDFIMIKWRITTIGKKGIIEFERMQERKNTITSLLINI